MQSQPEDEMPKCEVIFERVLSFRAVIEARVTEPGFDQLIPLFFWRSETIRSFIFSPIALEFLRPSSFLTA